jgi:CDK-activating kinase assembly factor MAT1
MKLMMATCGHKFCESCVTLTFLKDASLSCPECHAQLKRNSFIHQSFDDSAFEKQNSIRKRVLKIFNKRRDEFPTLKDYNDYLEMVEDLIFNLQNNSDVEKTTEFIKKYEMENQQSIIVNQSKKAEEDRALAQRIAEHERQFQARRQNIILQEQQEIQTLAKQRLELINFAESKSQRKSSRRKNKEVAATAPAVSSTTMTSSTTLAGDKFAYKPQLRPVPQTQLAPQQIIPKPLILQSGTGSGVGGLRTREMDQRAIKAGGYKEETVRLRALEEAFSALMFPQSIAPSAPDPPALPSLSPMKLT